MVFLDNKHYCKVGKSGFPVAIVKKRKKVIISKDTTFTVVTYNFTKMEIISSIMMICDILELINNDFYAK